MQEAAADGLLTREEAFQQVAREMGWQRLNPDRRSLLHDATTGRAVTSSVPTV